MKAIAAIVESVFAPAIRRINAREQRIVTHEDEADALLWDNARDIVRQLDAGLSQRSSPRSGSTRGRASRTTNGTSDSSGRRSRRVRS
jgi:hypothetical protein